MIIVSVKIYFLLKLKNLLTTTKIKLSIVVPIKDEITQNKLVLIYETNKKISEEEIFKFI